jgi:hypothetical protein
MPSAAVAQGVPPPQMPEFPRPDELDELKINPRLERGRDLFLGETKDYPGETLCFKVRRPDSSEWHVVPVTEENSQIFRESPLRALVARLYSCKAPYPLAGKVFSKRDFRSLVSYMNHEFELRLEN